VSKAETIDTTRDDYTTAEISDLVGVSQSYLRRLLGSGSSALRGRCIGGRVWLVEGRSLKRWLELREQGD
jgi:AraC-like DNA-binding protein